jgi:hypothetical protein
MHIINFFPDDSFYYLQTAINTNIYGTPTFDGENVTTGFHPLFFLFIRFLFIFFDKNSILYFLVLFNLGLIYYAYKVLNLIFKKNKKINLLLTLPIFHIYLITTAGIESSFVYLSILIFIHCWIKLKINIHQLSLKNTILIGFFTSIILLSRLDLVIPLSVFCLVIFFQKKLYRQIKNTFVIFPTTVIISLTPYFLWLFSVQNSLFPISSIAKHSRDRWEFIQVYNSLTSGSIFGLLVILALISIALYTVFYCFIKDKDSFLLPANLSSLVFLIYILCFAHEPYRWYLVYSSIVMIFSISSIAKSNNCFQNIVTKFPNYSLLVFVLLANLYFHVYMLNKNTTSYNYLMLVMLVNDEIPKNSKVAIHDAGVFGYFRNSSVHNMDGLINSKKNWDNYLSESKYEEYFDKYNIDYFLFQDHKVELDPGVKNLLKQIKNSDEIKKININGLSPYNLVKIK